MTSAQSGDFIRYVLIGDPSGRAKTYMVCPFIRTGKDAPSFPVAFKVASARAAALIVTANEIIQDGIGFQDTSRNTARWILENTKIREISERTELVGAYFPLVSGRGSSLVFRSRAEMMAQVQGALYPCFGRRENFQEALAWMVLRGVKAEIDRFVWTPKVDEQANAELSNSSFTSQTRSSTPRRQAGPVHHDIHSPQRPQASQGVSNGSRSSSNLSSTRTTQRVGPTSLNFNSIDLTEPPKVWSHVRTVRGIVETHFEPPSLNHNVEEEIPDFGDQANWYFKSHGYTSSTLWIFHYLMNSNKEKEDEFVEAIFSREVPRTEAEWIASLLYI